MCLHCSDIASAVPYNDGIVSFDDHIRIALDRALLDVHAPLDRAMRALANGVVNEVANEVANEANRVANDVAAEASARSRIAQAELDEVRRSAVLKLAELRASATRLSQAVRQLDAAQSLGEVLEVLAECGRREVERIAVFIVTAGRLRGHRSSGFAEVPAAASIDLSLDHAGIAGAVVRTGAMVCRPAADVTTVNVGLPAPFAEDAGMRDVAALPIVLGGTVVAVVYAEAPASDPASDPAALHAWSAALDLLTRHASRVLEAMTIRQVTGLSPLLSSLSPAPPRREGVTEVLAGNRW